MHEREAILQLWQKCESAALATVVEVKGSAYRHAGARMILSADGRGAGIINGGIYHSPTILKSATDSNGKPVALPVKESRRVVSTETSAHIRDLMRAVVDNSGRKAALRLDGYTTGGKTGTAQEVGGDCRCYQDGGLTVSFAGFAPADKPRFTVYVVVKHPGEGASGGGTAGPVFRKILSYVLQKYAVAPTGTTPVKIPTKWRPRVAR